MGNQKSRQSPSPNKQRKLTPSKTYNPHANYDNNQKLTQSIKANSEFKASQVVFQTLLNVEDNGEVKSKPVMTGSVYLRMPKNEIDKLKRSDKPSAMDYVPIIFEQRKMFDKQSLAYQEKLTYADALSDVSQGMSFCSAFTLMQIQFESSAMFTPVVASMNLLVNEEGEKSIINKNKDLYGQDWRERVKFHQADQPFLNVCLIKQVQKHTQMEKEFEKFSFDQPKNSQYIPKILKSSAKAATPPPSAPSEPQKKPKMEVLEFEEVFRDEPQPSYLQAAYVQPPRELRKSQMNKAKAEIPFDVKIQSKQLATKAFPRPQKYESENFILPQRLSALPERKEEEETSEFQIGDIRISTKNRNSRHSAQKQQKLQTYPQENFYEDPPIRDEPKLTNSRNHPYQKVQEIPKPFKFDQSIQTDNTNNPIYQSKRFFQDRESIYHQLPTPVNPEVHPLMNSQIYQNLTVNGSILIQSPEYGQSENNFRSNFKQHQGQQFPFFTGNSSFIREAPRQYEVLQPYRGPVIFTQTELQNSKIQPAQTHLKILDSPPDSPRQVLIQIQNSDEKTRRKQEANYHPPPREEEKHDQEHETKIDIIDDRFLKKQIHPPQDFGIGQAQIQGFQNIKSDSLTDQSFRSFQGDKEARLITGSSNYQPYDPQTTYETLKSTQSLQSLQKYEDDQDTHYIKLNLDEKKVKRQPQLEESEKKQETKKQADHNEKSFSSSFQQQREHSENFDNYSGQPTRNNNVFQVSLEDLISKEDKSQKESSQSQNNNQNYTQYEETNPQPLGGAGDYKFSNSNVEKILNNNLENQMQKGFQHF